MTNAQRSSLFFAVIIVVAIVSALTSVWLVRSRAKPAADAHNWLHEQLKLTEAQEKALGPAEESFAKSRAALMAEIRLANRDLAAAIRSDGRWSPAVEAAVERGQKAQGELQKLTVRHCLEMQAFLSPEQSRRLMEIAAQALSREAD